MPATCSECGDRTSEKPRPLFCGACGKAGTLLEDAAASIDKSGGRIRTLADDPQENITVACGVPELDLELGGFGVGTTVTLCGREGAGKSVLALRVAHGLCRSLKTRCLAVVPEMGEPMLYRCAQIARADLSLFTRSLDVEHWEDEADAIGARIVIIDSVSRMASPQETLTALIEYSRAVDGVGLALAHLNQKGMPLGPAGLRHDPDAWFRLEKLRRGRVLRVGKTPRWAPCGDSILLDQNQQPPSRGSKKKAARRGR